MPPHPAELFARRPLSELADHLADVAGDDFLLPVQQTSTSKEPRLRGTFSLGGDHASDSNLDSTRECLPFGWQEMSTLRPGPPLEGADLPPNHEPISVPNVDLEEYLGGGSFGCVYSGRVRSTGLVVAVKILRTDIVKTTDEGAQGAVREAMIGARLNHRNIMAVFDVRPVGNFWIVLMEFVQGSRLRFLKFEDDHKMRVFGQLADAVKWMGSKHIVHRDIKPDNIVVRRADGSPVIVDLGMAVDLAISAPEEFGVSGTPLFMPPEGFDGKVTLSFDAYSLGMTAFEVLVAGLRLGNWDLQGIIAAKKSGEFEREISSHLQGKNQELRLWILDLISADLDKRRLALEKACRWASGDGCNN